MGAATVLVVLALVYALGPRRVADPSAAREPALPADLDGWLAEREAQPDLRPDCGARIVWRDPATRRRTPLAVVYLHGFSGSPRDTAPLCARLAAALGANLFETRLRGHGRSEDAMGEATAEDWLGDALEAAAVGRRLGERVVLVGCSTGGTLATWLAARPAPDLAAVILISPNYGVRHPAGGLLGGPWGAQLARAVEGEYRSFRPVNERQERYWTTRYPTRAVVEMAALVDLVDRQDLSRMEAPVLILYSPRDRVCDPDRIEEQFARMGSSPRKLVPFEEAGDPAQHVLAGDILSPDATGPILDIILEFVRPLLAGEER